MTVRLTIWFIAICAALGLTLSGRGAEPFINFETAPVHPIDLSPDRARLAVANLPDGRLEVFDLTGPTPVPLVSVPVGVDPVSVRFRTASEVWVVNQISDSISVVDLNGADGQPRVVATLDTLDTPADVVFAGSPVRAFVSCTQPSVIQVFDPVSRERLAKLDIDAAGPKALAVSADGRSVYAAIFESGNGTTIIGAQLQNRLFVDNVVDRTSAPSGGQNPAFNDTNAYKPPLNPALPTNSPPPASGLIVRKDANHRWRDDLQRDWTEYVSGTNAALTQRVTGWDLPDRDLVIIDADALRIRYVTGLMNLCMAVAVNPASGRVAVVGTEARNEIRFEPNLNGTFAQVKLAIVDPAPFEPAPSSVLDLNPHLDYLSPTGSLADRDRSIGDPRSIVWTADGTTAYVAGLGSRNLVVLDADGRRRRSLPIEVGEGPCGLAVDDGRNRLYVYHRFSSSLSVLDTRSEEVVDVILLFDPTPLAVATGRRHLYDTRRTSGLGQVSCATCHVDARMDRLAWDLGNPAGDLDVQLVNQQGVFVTNAFHPMKGAMLTQTLQDIIGHEPFHWRGDKPGIESFNSTFTNLQGRPVELTDFEMEELRDFLASIRLPPNPHRPLDNSLPTNLPLPGHFASGTNKLSAGTPLPNGNAVAGFTAFNSAAHFCNECHRLPTGLGVDLPVGGVHHFPVQVRLEGSLRSKNAQFRNLADRIGMNTAGPFSRAGFGFGHDGSVDSLTRFLVGLRMVDDQETANVIALLLSIAGADITSPGAVPDQTPPAGVGRQFTARSSDRPALFDPFLALARSSSSRVEVIAKGVMKGEARGWYFDRALNRFQADRAGEALTPDQLLAFAADGQAITFTVVAQGTGRRLGIDRDGDGILDRDELDAGSNPADRLLQLEVRAVRTEVLVGTDFQLAARLPPLAAPGAIAWFRNGEPLAHETNAFLERTNVSFEASGDYSVRVTSPYQSLASLPLSIRVRPLIVTIAPASRTVRQGSNANFVATFIGLAPSAVRWQFNGADLPGAVSSTLTISNVQLAVEGSYRVIAANAFGSATSAPVSLFVLINPSVVIPPLSQSVTPGANATFGFQIAGHPPPFGYQLRRFGALVTNYVSDSPIGFFTLFNAQPANEGTYRIIVTNAANPVIGLSLGPATLSFLTDTDNDGLPDDWEVARGLNPDDDADAGSDLDHDGLSAHEEYLAGTEPLDAKSNLRIDAISAGAEGEVVLRYVALSNHTYAVQQRGSLTNGFWRTESEFVAGSSNRVVRLTNSVGSRPEGYFRLVSPRPVR